MPLQDKLSGPVLRTIKCDNVDCNKEITFDRNQEKETFETNPWLKSIRQITTLDQRGFIYCSDVCEIAGARSGQHNLPEVKKIISAATPADVNAAAQAEAAARKSDENLKTGTGGPVIVP